MLGIGIGYGYWDIVRTTGQQQAPTACLRYDMITIDVA